MKENVGLFIAGLALFCLAMFLINAVTYIFRARDYRYDVRENAHESLVGLVWTGILATIFGATAVVLL